MTVRTSDELEFDDEVDYPADVDLKERYMFNNFHLYYILNKKML